MWQLYEKPDEKQFVLSNVESMKIHVSFLLTCLRNKQLPVFVSTLDLQRILKSIVSRRKQNNWFLGETSWRLHLTSNNNNFLKIFIMIISKIIIIKP